MSARPKRRPAPSERPWSWRAINTKTRRRLHGQKVGFVCGWLEVSNTPVILRRIQRNPKLTTLPAGLFEYNNELGQIVLYNNGLAALPLGLFDGLDEVRYLGMTDNPLMTLPAGLFESMTSLAQLGVTVVDSFVRLDRNTDMQCLPDSCASYVKYDAKEGTRGCTANAASCRMGTTCSPGDSGYTCD